MLKSKNKNYFLVLILIVNIILGGILVWLAFDVNSLSEQNALTKRQLDDLSIKKSNLATNRLESLKINDSLQILDGYFVSADQKVLMIADLEKLASKAGVAYVLNNAVDASRVLLDISVKGSFRNIYYFISLMEANHYWVSFEKISLLRGTEKGIGVWSGSMVISIPNSD